jgi:2,4-dienoyl-CoA reductase-like NADH-dependent reductase (Old Yellow Enzyme family)
MAPLTRSRSEQPGDILGKLMLKYYAQHASDEEGLSVGRFGRLRNGGGPK